MFVQDGFLYLIVTRHKLTVCCWQSIADFYELRIMDFYELRILLSTENKLEDIWAFRQS
jgi:hypothetical protein